MTRRAGSSFSSKSNTGAGAIWLHTGPGHNASLGRGKWRLKKFHSFKLAQKLFAAMADQGACAHAAPMFVYRL